MQVVATADRSAVGCLIADDKHVHDIGGIMGGEVSGCTPDTAEVFIEVALFDPTRTAATGRKLDMGKSCIRFKKMDDIPLELAAFTELLGSEAEDADPDEGLDDRQQGKRCKPGRFINLRPNDFEI